MSWLNSSDPKREAFLNGDSEESRRLHDEDYVKLEETGGVAPQDHKETHPKAGEYIKSVVYGGLDGIITTFASVAGAAGASFPYSVVLVMGFVNLTADGLAMGVGDFMSSRAENQYVKNERKREEWEFDNYLEGEKRELVDVFTKRGLLIQDAREVVDILARCKDLFVDIMMTTELKLVPDTPNPSPIKNGLITVGSFLVFGIIPLIVYIIAGVIKGLDTAAGFDIPFLLACIFTVGILFGLGAITSKFTNQAFWKSGLFMLLNGGVTAGAAFVIGFLIEMLIDVEGVSVH